MTTEYCAGADSGAVETPLTWATEIGQHIELLRTVVRTSEDGFLSVGSQLQKIHLSTQNVSEKLAGLANGISAEGGTGSLSELQHMSERSVARLSTFNDFWLQAVGQLRQLEFPLSSLPESLKQFDRLVSRLRTMGITARIESARIGGDGFGFVHLAEEVTLLGEQISPKAKEVLSHIAGVSQIISLNEAKLREVVGNHEEIGLSITGDMESNLNLVDEKLEMSRDTASRISARSEEAIRSIGTIVQSVQYHDITRQEIGHIIEALETVRAEDSILEVVPICQIQAAHLRRAGNEFQRAVASIASALSDLSNIVTVMVSESEQMTSFARESANIFLHHVQSRLETISTATTKDQTAITEFTSSLGTISESILKMKSFMDEMAEVGSEIELLALNSRVTAAKLGNEGAGLGVIAESIQLLSVDAGAQIREVAAQMSQMVDVSSDLTKAQSIEAVTQEAGSETHDVTAKLEEAVRAFHLSNTMSIETFHETEGICKSVVAELESLVRGMDGHREIAVSLIRTSDMLERLAGDLRASVEESARMIIDKRIEEMLARYTMETERMTHTAVLNGNREKTDASSGPGEIELF